MSRPAVQVLKAAHDIVDGQAKAAQRKKDYEYMFVLQSLCMELQALIENEEDHDGQPNPRQSTIPPIRDNPD